MALNEIICQNAKPREKPYKLSDGEGMYLEVMPNGSKYWRLKYRVAGKEKRLSLGVYPTVKLAPARFEKIKAKQLLREGLDPSFARKENKRKQLEHAQNTFEAVARKWHEFDRPRWGERYAAAILHRMELDLFPSIGPLPIHAITRPQILTAIRAVEARGAVELARRALQYASRVFTYAEHEGLIPVSPVGKMYKALKPRKVSHYRSLSYTRIPEFLAALDKNSARLYPETIRATKMLLLTFVRTTELTDAKWCEFDLEKAVWTIPAERMKMREPHRVPLSRQVFALLQEQKEYQNQWDWVFPSRQKLSRPMSNNTILSAINNIGFKSETTGHGFRATAMTGIKEMFNCRHEVVDRQLAHAHKNKVDEAYDRADFWKKRVAMMQRWSDYVMPSGDARKVLPFAAPRRAKSISM